MLPIQLENNCTHRQVRSCVHEYYFNGKIWILFIVYGSCFLQMGVNYYPKLQCAVPFSPVPGARLLVAPGEDPAELRKTILRVLPQVADALKVCIPMTV